MRNHGRIAEEQLGAGYVDGVVHTDHLLLCVEGDELNDRQVGEGKGASFYASQEEVMRWLDLFFCMDAYMISMNIK